ncbi:MAG TPA: LLM class flavin-dependent oxidoreductase [Streptosporangiaceae bacterium]|nr:LLM class flavin-dependent oxidoreductase [Streptosporangiaceae bacterium]
MRLSMVFAGSAPIPVQQKLAAQAEEAGLCRLWTTESQGSDGLLRAMAIGLATSRILIGTGIAYTFPRVPLHAAGAAADLAETLGGRFTFGLGAGTKGIRRRYGLVEDHPAPRFAEYVQLLRGALTSEGGFEFEGRFYSARAPSLSFNAGEATRRAIEIYGSGVNRIILETTAQYCDGVAIHPLAGIRPYFDEVTAPALERGSARADWRPGKLATALWYICSVHDDPVIARERAAMILAFYFSTPSYATPLQGTRWEQTGEKLREAFRTAGYPTPWDELARLVPGEMIEDICLVGTAQEVRRKIDILIKDLEPMGIDELVLEPTSHGGITEFIESCTGIIAAAATHGVTAP